MRNPVNETIAPKLVFAVLGLAMAAPSWAVTAPALQLTDGVNTVTIDSTATVTFSAGCACSTTAVSASAGQVAWSGTIGPFTVTHVNGRTKPSLGSLTSPTIDVGLSGLTTGSTGGTLTISWSDVGFDGVGPVTLNQTTSIFGSGMALYNGYVDPSNSLFGKASLVGTIGPTMGNGVLTGPGPTAEQFSMTAVEAINLGPFAFFLNDYQLIGTPVPALTLSCSAASGLAGTPYNSSLVANGGVPAYTFSLLSGSLPPGLNLSPASGLISGTPTATGSFNFVTQVMDSLGASASTAATGGCTIMITVQTPLSLACSANTGQVGVAYSSSLVATGGLPPYNMFSIIPANGLPAGLFLNAMTGAITGTPTAPGTFNFTSQVVDSNGNTAMNSASNSCSVGIAPVQITVTCSTVNSGEVGAGFNSPAPTVTGGMAPYTFSLAPGSTLPAGLTLDASTGAITGTPTAAGTFSIQVTDANGAVSASTCPYTIVPAPSLTCSAAGSGEVGVAFNGVAPTVAGGTAPFTFSLAPGSTLPAGLTLNASTGAVTGTPTAAGTFNIQVTDAKGVVAASSCPYTIVAPPTLTCSATGSGEVGVAFNGTAPTVAGGTAPFTFSLPAGSTLPAGLTLNASTGAITGTPTAAGTFSIQVTDANGVVAASTCPYTVVPAPTLTCSAVGSGEVGVAFNGVAPTVAGGTAPFTFSLAPGSTLPAGLTLNASTGAITGTPTAAGTFSIQVTDANGVVAASTCPYTVVPAPTLTCSAVGSGEVGVTFNGTAPTIAGGTAPFTFSLAPGSTLPAGLTLNASTGAITGTPTAAGTFSIQVTDAKGVVTASACPYTIVPAPSITCSATNMGEAGVAFDSPAMTVTGGTAPYTFSVATGILPAGLTLNTSNGAITGTPTAPGTFTIKVTDANGVSSTSCSFSIVPAPGITCSATNSGEVGVAFNSPMMTVTGGTAPYTFSVATGTLPAGLTLNTSNGAITGTPTAPGTFTIKVTDANGVSSTSCSFSIVPAPSITCSATNSGEVGVAFNSPMMTVTGGTAPYTFSVATGTLPAGLTLNTSNGAITGTPTAPGTFTIKVTDANGASSSSCSFSIAAPPTLSCSTVSSGEVGVAFNGTAPTVNGGTAPYAFSVATGTLPAGLTLNASTGAITGMPTAAGTFTIQVKDSKGSVAISTCPYTIVAPPTLTCSAVSSGEVGVALDSPAPTVTGGVAPYAFSVGTGTLPAGLTLNTSTGAITGTPTAAGTFTIKVTDHNGSVTTTTCPFVVVTHVNLVCGTCGASKATTGTAYSASLSVTGGTGTNRYSIASGSLPPGLTLNTSTGVISGAPTTVGTYTFTSQAVDSDGGVDTATCTIVVTGPPINLNCGTCGAGKATVGTPYSAQFSLSGGTAPFTYSITSGSLPPGLTLNTSTGAITGTPTTAGNYTITTKVVDKNGSFDTTTCTIVVQPSPITLNCGPCSASKAMVGASYSATMTVTGGTGPYTYSIVSGTLPPGLTLNGSTGTISGTPTTGGTYTMTARVVDKNGSTDTDVCTIVVSPPPVNLDCGACGSTSGKVGSAYSTTLALSGGQSPFKYSISSGSLPPGLTLNTSTGVISGTPTTAGSYTFTSKVVDANGNWDTATCTIVVTGSPLNLDCGTCGASKATVGTSYSATYSVSGGTGPFTYSIISGSLPGGLTLNSSTGVISGKPTGAGTYTFTAKVVDKNGNTDTQACTIVVVASPIDLECGSCGSSNGSVGTAYSSALAVTGGTGPYTYSVISGSLPGGLTLNSSTGVISGTPTTAGSFTFTSKIVDKNGNTDTTTCTIVVVAAALNLNCGTCGASQATVGAPYSATYSVVGGTGPFTYSILSGSLPAGLTLNSSTGAIGGTPTTAGTYTFTAKVVDAKGKTDTQACTVVVVTPVITLNCGPCSAAKGWVGQAYSATMTVTGGAGPFTYSIISGSLPAGLTLNSSTGTIGGTPTTAGTYTVTAKVVDKNGNSDTDVCTIVVQASPISLGCGSCMSGKAYVGQAYSTMMSVTGGTGPYTFSTISGALPGGLTLNTSTGALTGMPTQKGTYTFTSKVVDKNGSSDTTTCTIVVE